MMKDQLPRPQSNHAAQPWVHMGMGAFIEVGVPFIDPVKDWAL